MCAPRCGQTDPRSRGSCRQQALPFRGSPECARRGAMVDALTAAPGARRTSWRWRLPGLGRRSSELQRSGGAPPISPTLLRERQRSTAPTMHYSLSHHPRAAHCPPFRERQDQSRPDATRRPTPFPTTPVVLRRTHGRAALLTTLMRVPSAISTIRCRARPGASTALRA